jgi:uncharacterized protein with FMN-binding domain
MTHFLMRQTLAAAAVMLAACGAARSAEDEIVQVATETTMRYRDGSYTADGLYGGLPSRLTVTLTITNDKIEGVSVQTHATDPTSLDLQRRFAQAVPAVVIGRPLADVHVGKLAGSSVTPDGFNAAVERIRLQAARSP